jgi:hypothetical protein
MQVRLMAKGQSEDCWQDTSEELYLRNPDIIEYGVPGHNSLQIILVKQGI